MNMITNMGKDVNMITIMNTNMNMDILTGTITVTAMGMDMAMMGMIMRT